jgi:hypothetical protein
MGIILSVCRTQQHRKRKRLQKVQRSSSTTSKHTKKFISPGEWTVRPPDIRYQYDSTDNDNIKTVRERHHPPSIREMIQHLKKAAIGQIWLESGNFLDWNHKRSNEHLHMINLSILWSIGDSDDKYKFLENRHIQNLNIAKKMENKLPFQHNDPLMITLHNYISNPIKYCLSRADNIDDNNNNNDDDDDDFPYASASIYARYESEIIGNIRVQSTNNRLELSI